MKKVAFLLILMINQGFSQELNNDNNFLKDQSTPALVGFQSSNLPIVIINTVNNKPIPDSPKIDATMGIIYNGEGVRNNLSDPFNEFYGKIGIEIRGSSSQGFPKKQWSIETRDNQNNPHDVTIFNMAFDNNWVLYAPYSDKTLMRNVFTYQLAFDLGDYAPRTKFCEVILNGSYEGVYVFIEKIKRKDGKVGVNDVEPEDISGNELSGDYILKVDKTTGNDPIAWASPFPPNTEFIMDEPSYYEANTTQRNYIKNYITSFETTLNNSNFKDPILGYAPYIDLNSFIDFFLVNELSRNVDGYRISSYLYKLRESEGGKLHAGPIWDFNLAFGNADYCDGFKTFGWQIDFNTVCSTAENKVPFWWKRLLQDNEFKDKVSCRWQHIRRYNWHNDTLIKRIDKISNYLDESQNRNFQRWNILGTYVWPNYFVGSTYAQEINFLKSWLLTRLNWMDNNMFGTCTNLALDERIKEEVMISPNPGKNEFNFSFNEFVKNASVEIVDLNGKQYYYKTGINGYNYNLYIDNISPGMYYYLVRTTKNVSSGKIIIIE